MNSAGNSRLSRAGLPATFMRCDSGRLRAPVYLSECEAGGEAPLQLTIDEAMLGGIGYGNCRLSVWEAPLCAVPLVCLDASAVTLAWSACSPPKSGELNGVFYRSDSETLFGVYRDGSATAETIEASTAVAYRAMLAAAANAGYPHIYRIWNYLPDINREVGGLEVYQSFCIGRQRVFGGRSSLSGAASPAACAIGTHGPGFYLFFAASKRPALHLSNPRQVEAYRYPRRYGPKSPAFSRAVLLRREQTVELHLSGTASIVGHQSVHPGDVEAQVTETLHNLEALSQQAGVGLADLRSNALLHVYLRHEADFPTVEKRLSERLAPEVTRLFLCGDICRRSLLLEIEGIISLPRSALPEPLESACH